MLQAIFYLSLALSASSSAPTANDLASEVLSKSGAPVASAQKLQTSSKKAEAQKAAKKKADQKKTTAKKSTAKKDDPKAKSTETAKAKPVETAKTPWVMPDAKARAAQRESSKMTTVAKASAKTQTPVKPAPVKPAPVRTPTVATASAVTSIAPAVVTATPPAQNQVTDTPKPDTLKPDTLKPETPKPESFAPAPVIQATVTETPPAAQTSPLNPLADILPPEVIAAAQTNNNQTNNTQTANTNIGAAPSEAKAAEATPEPVTAPIPAPVSPPVMTASAPKTPVATPVVTPVVKPAPVITPTATIPSTPVLTVKTPAATVTPPATLSAPVASNIAPPTAEPKAVLPSAQTAPQTTLAKAVKVDSYSRDYEGPKSGRELQYDAGIARAFGSKIGQMGSLEGSWLVSGQDGKRLLSLELRSKTGGQVDGAWRALNSGFGLNRSGLVSDASLSESNELSLSYMERGARTPSHLKLQKSGDGSWRGTLTDGNGHTTPVVMAPDQAS